MKRHLWSKFKRTKIFVVFVAVLCFILGLLLPILFLREKVESKSVNGPLSRFLVPQRPLIPSQHNFRNNTLEEVFISVKTTRKFHYPRLIILLETWVSLVRSQVSNYQIYTAEQKWVVKRYHDFCVFPKLNNFDTKLAAQRV